MMGKQPAFQFYVGDWLKDTRGLSLEAKGAWIDILNFMWHSETRGKLSLKWLNYSRHLGTDIEQTKRAISELIDLNICDCYLDSDDKKITNSEDVRKCNKNVILINRRMYREDKLRKNNAFYVAKYREKQKSKENVRPISSTSVFIKKYIKKNEKKENCNIGCKICKFGSKVEENFFSCNHPEIERSGKDKSIKKLNISFHDRDREYFVKWPEKFNINWLIYCDGFKGKNGKTG